MTLYNKLFILSVTINAVATFRYRVLQLCVSLRKSGNKNAAGDETPNGPPTESRRKLEKTHQLLLKRYLIVYLCAVLSDWLQGPYVYALYDAYGYSQHHIAILFVAGFGSSMVFGSFIGGLADTYGRRKFTILFAAIYAISCITKHFRNFGILMVGRILGGVATSLLFSVFDSWFIRSHADNGVTKYLPVSFSLTAYGNSLVAIFAGLMAEKATVAVKLHPLFGYVDDEKALTYVGGYLIPFDMSIVALILCGGFTMFFWEENYGENIHQETSQNDSEVKAWYESFSIALRKILHSSDILLCGSISALFEGSMYIFVFMWTPFLKSKSKDNLPFGYIFSIFMNCCMTGSSIFAVLVKTHKCETLGFYNFITAAFAFTVMLFSSTETELMLGFMVFEICVGMYFPIMGTMKSEIVPEERRATTYNIYRIPLNCIVVLSLLTDFTPETSFKLCTIMMIVAMCLQWKLKKLQSISKFVSTNSSPNYDHFPLSNACQRYLRPRT